MTYKQLKFPTPNIWGTSGLCLNYARRVFGVAAKYGDAWAAWTNAKYKHTEALPNVAVPIWFEYKVRLFGVYKNWGHVAVYIPGVGIYSTCNVGVKLFPSIAALERYISGIKYVGWSEDINGVRVAQPVAAPAAKMPKVGQIVHLDKGQVRTTFRPGTVKVAGHINVTDNTFDYLVRGYDSKYKYRILINSKSAGGNGVALALYYTNGVKIPGWSIK